MKVHNVGFETITEGISKKRRQYDAASPLRKSYILDGRELFVLITNAGHDRYNMTAGRVSHYPSYVFKTREKAQEFLNEVGATDHEVTSVYDQLRVY